MQKIVVMPVKNEEWILEKSLAAAALFADHIIVADQGSMDATAEICRRFSKVIRITNPKKELDQSYARQLLLDEVRARFGTDTILCALDADEILSANCLVDARFNQALEALEPGESMVLQWIMLWGSANEYRSDSSIWSNNWKHFIFRDDGTARFANEKTSEPRMPTAYMRNAVRYEAVKVLHFQFVDRARMLAKQRRYQVYDFEEQPSWRRALAVNRMYFEAKEERGVRTVPVESAWWSGYPDSIRTSGSRANSAVYWYDLDVLKHIAERGAHFFSWLAIWDMDWEEQRQKFLAEGAVRDVGVIMDPRNYSQKFYHRFGQYFLARLVEVYRFLKRIF